MKLSGRRAQFHGTVRLYATQLLAGLLFPSLLPSLMAEHPGLQIDLIAGDELPDLLSREADIGFWIQAPKQLDIVSRKLGDFQIVACASPAYLAQHGEPADLPERLQHRMIGHDKLDTMPQWFRQFAPGIERQRFVLRTDDKASYLQAVKAGVGIGFLASYLLGEGSGLTRILPALPLPKLPLWLITHREISSNPLIKATFEHLSSEVLQLLNRTRVAMPT